MSEFTPNRKFITNFMKHDQLLLLYIILIAVSVHVSMTQEVIKSQNIEDPDFQEQTLYF